jgi:hypothetical protein
MGLVRRWEVSETSQQAVADATGVSVHTLRYWATKLRAEERPVLSRPRPRDFVEVTGVRAVTQSVAIVCRVHLGERVVLELPTLPPVEWLRALSRED